MALVEALIDFGEGEDVEEGVYDEGTCTHQSMIRGEVTMTLIALIDTLAY